MKNSILIFLIVLFPLGFLLFFGLALRHDFNTLPHYHPSELLLDSTNNELGKSHSIPNFSFQNFDGRTIKSDSLQNDVYILAPYSLNSEYVSVITKRLLTINFKYRDETNIKVIGLNSDGVVRDSLQLKDYMMNLFKNRDEKNNFFFLSAGSASEMEAFIKEGIAIQNIENSALVVLIDPKGQIRGRYNLNAEKQASDAVSDIALLRKEITDGKYKAEKQTVTD